MTCSDMTVPLESKDQQHCTHLILDGQISYLYSRILHLVSASVPEAFFVRRCYNCRHRWLDLSRSRVVHDSTNDHGWLLSQEGERIIAERVVDTPKLTSGGC